MHPVSSSISIGFHHYFWKACQYYIRITIKIVNALYCRLGGLSWPIMAPNGASSFVSALSLMLSSLLCKLLRSRSICNSNTAHSTSYYTLDKLPHIRQASSHSTSYRTHTLKSIPPISAYTQVRSCRHRCFESTHIHPSPPTPIQISYQKNRGCIRKWSDQVHRPYYKCTVRTANVPSVVQTYRPRYKRTVRSTNVPSVVQMYRQ